MSRTPTVHVAKNGRRFLRFPDGRTKFISNNEAAAFTQPPKPRATRPTTSARVTVSGTPEIDFNERQLGHVLRGFVDAARGGDRAADVARMFGDAVETSREETLLLDLGRDLFDHLAAALTYFDVAPDEWASWFKRTGPSRAPTTLVPAFAPTSATTWLPPVVGRVTQRFGGGHSGVDIACPVGTAVVAPVDLKVNSVGFDATAGHFVVADAMRDDGSFDGDGYRITFAHLSDVDVTQGQVVRRGQVLAQSGATGNATGPHLHLRTEWIDDGVFRDKALAVDPFALIPEAVISGAAQPQPIAGGATTATTSDGQPINVIVAPGAGRVSIGHGIIQPDTDVRVNSNDVKLESFVQPLGDDPLLGIVHDVQDVVASVARPVAQFVNALVTPDNVRALGAVTAGASGVVGAAQPETLPVTGPLAAAGTIVASNAQPIANAVKAVSDPLDGII